MSIFNKLVNTIKELGITPNLEYIDVQIIKQVNISAFCCIPLGIIYCFDDYLAGHNILLYLTIGFILTVIAGLILNKYNLHKFGKAALLFISPIYLIIAGLIYSTNAEYFIICVMFAIIFIYRNQTLHILSIIVLFLAILIIKVSPLHFLIDQSANSHRDIMNIIVGIFCLVVFTILFKNTIVRYRKTIKEQHANLLQTNSTLEQLIRIISHDIRSPLNATHSLLTIYKAEGEKEEEEKLHLDLALESIKNLDDTLLNLLEWSTKNHNGLNKSAQNVNIKEYIDLISQQLQSQLLLKKIELIKDIPDTVEAYIDPNHFIIIIRNLLTNAIKFSFNDTNIYISTQVNGTETIISIKDTGVGIPEEKLDSLLENIQIPSYGTQGERGFGTGLALCSKLLIENNCKIDISSKLNNGTTFNIHLPKTQSLE